MLIVQTTCASRKEAEKIGEALVREHLAACAAIHKCNSIFLWEGRLQKENEWLLELKAPNAKYARIEQRIRQLHSYKLPQIVAVPVARASKDYASWVDGA